MDLSIIIVNYCTYELTKQTIYSVINTINEIDYEIFVVDNNSPDNSLNQLLSTFDGIDFIKFIKNDNNDGFAVANNLALKESSGEYVLLLNSDVVVNENTINNCIDFIKNHNNVACVGCKVLLENGQLDKACRRSFPSPEVSFYRMTGLSKIFPNSKRFNKYNLSYLDDDGIYSIDCIVGAFMLIDSNVLNQIGGLDEDYFMYGEDIELCYAIKKLGYDIYYYGKSNIIHYKGASGKNKRLLYEFHKSMSIFYDKHYKNKSMFITNYIIKFGIWSLYYLKLALL